MAWEVLKGMVYLNPLMILMTVRLKPLEVLKTTARLNPLWMHKGAHLKPLEVLNGDGALEHAPDA